jgi:hypothetical protein
VQTERLECNEGKPFSAVKARKLLDGEKCTLSEALVSRETFQRVQDILAGRQVTIAPRQRYSPEFPLRNFVRCGACDSPLTGSFSTGRNKKKISALLLPK